MIIFIPVDTEESREYKFRAHHNTHAEPQFHERPNIASYSTTERDYSGLCGEGSCSTIGSWDQHFLLLY